MTEENPLRRGIGRYLNAAQTAAARTARVGVAGAGGLGSNAALMLARSGLENFLLVDDDTVEASNLNRQQFWPRHVGMPKVDALKSLLLELNPAARVETLRLRLTEDNAARIVRACPLWLEALDGARDKRLFVEAALSAGLRVASASGIAGYGREPLGRRRLGRLVVVGDFSTDVADAPPLAPRVTEAAALLADAALTWILE